MKVDGGNGKENCTASYLREVEKKNKEEEKKKERKAATQVCFSQQIESLPSAFSPFSHIRSVLLHITIRPPLSPINPPGNSLHFFLFLFGVFFTFSRP